jgi:hypothetical protein
MRMMNASVKEKSPGRSSDGRKDWLKMVSEER